MVAVIEAGETIRVNGIRKPLTVVRCFEGKSGPQVEARDVDGRSRFFLESECRVKRIKGSDR